MFGSEWITAIDGVHGLESGHLRHANMAIGSGDLTADVPPKGRLPGQRVPSDPWRGEFFVPTMESEISLKVVRVSTN
jgi:hypothetical protein